MLSARKLKCHWWLTVLVPILSKLLSLFCILGIQSFESLNHFIVNLHSIASVFWQLVWEWVIICSSLEKPAWALTWFEIAPLKSDVCWSVEGYCNFSTWIRIMLMSKNRCWSWTMVLIKFCSASQLSQLFAGLHFIWLDVFWVSCWCLSNFLGETLDLDWAVLLCIIHAVLPATTIILVDCPVGCTSTNGICTVTSLTLTSGWMVTMMMMMQSTCWFNEPWQLMAILYFLFFVDNSQQMFVSCFLAF